MVIPVKLYDHTSEMVWSVVFCDVMRKILLGGVDVKGPDVLSSSLPNRIKVFI